MDEKLAEAAPARLGEKERQHNASTSSRSKRLSLMSYVECALLNWKIINLGERRPVQIKKKVHSTTLQEKAVK